MSRMLEKLHEEECPFGEVFKTTGIGHGMQAVIVENFSEPYHKACSLRKAAGKVVVKDEKDTASMQAARELHAPVRDLRLSVEKTRKALKDESLRTGQAIDGVARILKDILAPMEESLLAAATFAERLRAERMERLASGRREELTRLEFACEGFDLAMMEEASYQALLATAKAGYEKLVESRRTEQERQRAEAERLRAENDRLRKEQDELRKERDAEASRRAVAERANKQARKAQEDEQRRAAAEVERLARLPEKARVREYVNRLLSVERPVVKDATLKEVLAVYVHGLSELSEELVSTMQKL